MILITQQWFGLADEALEDALYDSQSMREFLGLDLSRESVPDATTRLKFRHKLTARLFEGINAHLAEQGLLLLEGTMVDAYREIRDVVKRNRKINDLRTAAMVVAITKVAGAYESLGIFP